MKLSAQHDSGGLSGSIRSIQTGEVVHFQFSRNTTRLPLEVVLGDKRLEVQLHIEKVETDIGDDFDIEMMFRAPDVSAPASLDYVSKISPPVSGGKIDQDGAAMNPPEEGEPVIMEDAPVDKKELVLEEKEKEKDKYQITTTPLALQQAEASEQGLFDTEEQVGVETSKDSHPATQIPTLPGVGSSRKSRKRF